MEGCSIGGPYRDDAWVWRDGRILAVKEIAPDQFPEDRSARDRFAEAILPGCGSEEIAGFVLSRISG
jgi:hypothetical protein